MEKKVAFVLLAVVALAGWSVTLLFVTGNPFAQTEGTYRYNISNITVSIPLNWFNSLQVNSPQSGFASFAPRLVQNVTTEGDYIYIHLGNISIDLEGKNWELVVTRIANSIAGYAFLSNFRGLQVEINEPSVQWNPLVINGTMLTVLGFGVILGFVLMYAPRIYLAVKNRRRVTL